MYALTILKNLSEIFLILRRVQRDGAINVHRSSLKFHVFLFIFSLNLNFLDRLLRNSETSYFVNIRSASVEVFYAQTSMTKYIVSFSNFCERA